jgi:hypothetical protein
MRAVGPLDRLGDLGIGPVDEVAGGPADLLLPVRQRVDERVDARVLRVAHGLSSGRERIT